MTGRTCVMRSLILLPLLLAACAGPSEYHRGAPAPLPPAPPMPGVGAPVMGQPGSFSEPLPRSPNSRVLPPSTEPGLWSSDRPRATRQEYVLPPVFGFTPPAVEPEEALVALYANGCASMVGRTARFPSVAKALAQGSAGDVACVGARTYFGCLVSLWLEVQAKQDRASKVLADALELYQQRLQKEVNKACAETGPGTKSLQRMVETALRNSSAR